MSGVLRLQPSERWLGSKSHDCVADRSFSSSRKHSIENVLEAGQSRSPVLCAGNRKRGWTSATPHCMGQGMRQVTTGLGSLFNDAGDDDDGNDPLVFVKPKDPSTQAAKPAAKVRNLKRHKANNLPAPCSLSHAGPSCRRARNSFKARRSGACPIRGASAGVHFCHQRPRPIFLEPGDPGVRVQERVDGGLRHRRWRRVV